MLIISIYKSIGPFAASHKFNIDAYEIIKYK